MLVTGKISFVRALLYILLQCLGATAGTASLKALVPDAYHNTLGHTNFAEGVTPMQGLGLEFFLGFILIFTVFGVCDGNKPGMNEVPVFLILNSSRSRSAKILSKQSFFFYFIEVIFVASVS